MNMKPDKNWYWKRDIESFDKWLKILNIASTERSIQCCKDSLERIQSRWPAPHTQKVFNDMRKENQS